MTIIEFFRNRIFWLLDRVGGGTVYQELFRLKAFEKMDNDKINTLSTRAIKKLQKHAANTTSFYAPYINKDLNDWPVVTKMDIKSKTDSFISSNYKKEKLVKMSTSGSTGTPLTVYHDRLKKKATYAEVLYYNGKVGYQIGKRIIYLRSIVSEVSKSKLQQIAQNIMLVDCNDLSDKGIENKLSKIANLTKHNEAVMMGYASTLDAFRDYFSRNGVKKAEKCNLSGVISGSEILFDETRFAIEQAFGCPCVSRYANEEQGFLGQDEFENNVFITNRAHFFFEILKQDIDETVDNNEVGRIVVTDLKNYSMPLIRYDTGDIGRLENVVINNKNYQIISDFSGRRIDMIFNVEGERISPHSITNAMWSFPNIKQYQFIQNSQSNYTIKINIDKNFEYETILIKKIKKIVGDKATIDIKYVSDIPTLNSGKRKYIVNNM